VLAIAKRRQAEAVPLFLSGLLRIWRLAFRSLKSTRSLGTAMRIEQALRQQSSRTHSARVGPDAASGRGGDLVQ
jgi:hypothetical protein